MISNPSQEPSSRRSYPQVKICGLTLPEEAAACADLGAHAIGLIFFAKSPRNLSTEQAKAVVDALPPSVDAVGVFVNAPMAFITERVDRCRLTMVQLHGRESPDVVAQLQARGVGVIKALFMDGTPDFSEAQRYRADALLTECAKGPLPGGNAMVWDWGAARTLGKTAPLVLAGGLSPDNIGDAVRAALPAAVDVSSGVERSPGRKDLGRVARLMEQVRHTAPLYTGRPSRTVFRTRERRGDATP